ncbi:hypothetical protein [Mesorhizobium sp.]|uniref:hypothetical protein n=1 Tax=Mesorhizobium sp. TaxID=1871066 RepID=UPI0025B7D3C8|nr:hypothetical protein [Mesorhizobium sp.]
MLDAVKAWPGNLAAGRGAIAPASLDCVSTRSHWKSCRGEKTAHLKPNKETQQESKKPKSRLSMSSVGYAFMPAVVDTAQPQLRGCALRPLIAMLY